MKLSVMLWEVRIMLHRRFYASIMDLRQMYGVQELFYIFYSVVYHLSGLVFCFSPKFMAVLESTLDAVYIMVLKTFSCVCFCLFTPETEMGIFRQILRGKLDFDSEPWPGISDFAKDLIRKMLDRNPKTRLTAHEVLCKQPSYSLGQLIFVIHLK